MLEDEAERVRERYARRSVQYDPMSRWMYMSRQELERALIRVLGRELRMPVNATRLLEVGCGAGSNLLQFLRLGFRPDLLVGIELLEDRVRAARQVLPQSLVVHQGDALAAVLPSDGFDVVFQSLVFSSILDTDFRARLAARMWQLVKVGGGVLWYDFTYDNPANADVRGVPVAEVRRLFPGGEFKFSRLTLAPPISRRVVALGPGLYSLFNSVPFLRTHVLCWIGKIS